MLTIPSPRAPSPIIENTTIGPAASGVNVSPRAGERLGQNIFLEEKEVFVLFGNHPTAGSRMLAFSEHALVKAAMTSEDSPLEALFAFPRDHH